MNCTATRKPMNRRKAEKSRFVFRALPLLLALLLLLPSPSHAISKGELLSKLFGSLELFIAPQAANTLPPDVKPDYAFSNIIRSAAKYGIISAGEPFAPDATATRSDALYLALCSMGWRFEVGLSQKISELPEFAGSGDPILFMAAEIVPQAPVRLLSGGVDPASDEEIVELLAWVALCKGGVIWNRVFSYEGIDLILYRQGVGNPSNGAAAGARQAPLYIAAIAATPARVEHSIVFAEPLGSPRLPLSQIAQSASAVGAVNGGFFHEGRPIGSLMQGGVPIGKPYPGRSAIGWTAAGEISFGSGSMKSAVNTPSGTAEISAYNVPPAEGAASLYSPTVTPAANGLHPETLEVHVENGVILSKRLASESDHLLPQQGFMIAARGRVRELLNELQEGSALTLQKEWHNPDFAHATHVIQAGPMLLSNGAAATTGDEAFQASVIEKQHPRTFVGVDASNRMMWAVVDGRNPMHSTGGSIAETRWIAKSLGMTHALNLDGGGSSTLWWRGIVANRPSDGKERPIPYGIILRPK